MAQIGYIYVRSHPSYDAYDACKMGKTMNIPERDAHYATGEIRRGYFEVVFEVPIKKLGIIERLLQYEFRKFNIKYDAGIEFYNKEIIELIEPYLIAIGVVYKKLSTQEISDLVRCHRVKRTIQKINIPSLIRLLRSVAAAPLYSPRSDQSIIIGKSILYFQQHDKGVLVLMCGVGKTLISLWIAQGLNAGTILIGVPNKLLLKQWEGVVHAIFQNVPHLIVSSGITVGDVSHFLKANRKLCIVITTYASAHKVYAATQKSHFNFDMKILDEAHHLTSGNMQLAHTTKTYIQMLSVPSAKQLSLTATLKHLEGDGDAVVSNDDAKYFGEIIDRKCLLWAINENIVCDYVIQTIITRQLDEKFTKFHIVEENDKRLFLSAFAALKSIHDGNSHHLLIYSNSKVNSLKIVQYIKKIMSDVAFGFSDIYYSNYHSEMKSSTQKEILHNFDRAKYGIISCVYCLGEGWDFPLLDGVVFAENMTSNIRIVQSALRASRKNANEPNKITKIILPILNGWMENNDNSDLKKVREVIYQMGLEDETITQKIKVIKINITPAEKQEKQITFGEYDDELLQSLLLKTIRRPTGVTYEKARKILADKNLRSKEEYYAICGDLMLPIEPDIEFKGQFTNWIDYLGIARKYYDLDTCRCKVREYLVQHTELKMYCLDLTMICGELCKIDALFPPNDLWVEYYGIKQLGEIIIISSEKKKIGYLL